MHITLDQARALDALAREGTLQKAALSLHKGHTAVLYALASLEEQAALTLLDRSGYRLKLTPEGESVLLHCRALLTAERELYDACERMKTGWEPSVKLVLDGLCPIDPVLRWMKDLTHKKAPTKVSVSAEFLGGVEEAFRRDACDFMIAVLPPEKHAGLTFSPLPPIRAYLVAHGKHPLAQARKKLSTEALKEHVLLTVRGGDPRLSLSTAGLEARSTVHLNDFDSKKRAIQGGLGFGWLPDHVVRDELKKGTLKVLRYEGGAEHTFSPHLYRREGRVLGRAGTALLATLSRAPRARSPEGPKLSGSPRSRRKPG